MTAVFSTCEMSPGTAITARGLRIAWRWAFVFLMQYWSIFIVMSGSWITPWRIGRTAMMLPGVRPSMRLASSPTARTRCVPSWTATTEGSRRMMPRSLA